MQRVLITGGAGFVGSHLVALLAGQGHRILVLDNLSTGSEKLLPTLDGVQLVRGDIRDEQLLRPTFEGFRPSLVFHLAAIHYIPRCEAEPREAVSVNVEGTVSVLQACQAFPPEKLVFASTLAVYGPKDRPHTESEVPEPMDTYGVTKVAGEQLVGLFSRRTGVPGTVVRLSNVYGPNETNPHLIPEMVGQLLDGSGLLELGNLEPKRDYVHATDVARALALLGASKNDTQGLFNIGTGQARSVSDLVGSLRAIWPEPIRVVQVPDKMRAVDRPYLAADTSRIRAAVGWSPTVDLQTGLRELLEP